jgi:hypothetical protein
MLGQVLLTNTFYICEDSKPKAFSVFYKHFQPSNFIKTSPLKISHQANSLYPLLGNVYYQSFYIHDNFKTKSFKASYKNFNKQV